MDEQQILIRIIESGWAQCTTILQEDSGILATALIAGLVGSATHCVGMCGPFVISQVTSRMEKLPLEKMTELRRLTGAALLPYQFGRLTTYTLLGVMAGFFADSITVLTKIWWLGPMLLLCAALFFLIFGVIGLVPHLAGLFPNVAGGNAAGAWWNRVVGNRIKPLFGAPFGWRGYLLGVMLGFIPCGLIYGALVLAAAGGNALTGGFVMAVFGLGTVPMLFATGVIGQYATQRFRTFMAPVGRGLMVVNAIVLAMLAFHQIG